MCKIKSDGTLNTHVSKYNNLFTEKFKFINSSETVSRYFGSSRAAVSRGGDAPRDGNITPYQYKLPNVHIDIKLSDTYIEKGSIISLFYFMKVLRWKLYSKSKNLLETVFKDFIMTVILFTIVNATKMNSLSFSILLDGIFSFIIFEKTADDRTLLFPYFLIFNL
jgi:hypothetical protein